MPELTGKEALIVVSGGMVQDCILVPAVKDDWSVFDYDFEGASDEEMVDYMQRITGLDMDQIGSIILDLYLEFKKTGKGVFADYPSRNHSTVTTTVEIRPADEPELIDRIKERLSFLKKIPYKDLKMQYMWCSGFLVALVDHKVITNSQYEELWAEVSAIFQGRQERKE